MENKWLNKTKELAKKGFEKSKVLAEKGLKEGKVLAKKGAEKTKEEYGKAKKKVEQKIHDKKEDIALEVIKDTRRKVKSLKDESLLKDTAKIISSNYKKGGSVGEVISIEGNYLSISATKDKMTIKLNEDGKDEVEGLRQDGKSDSDIMWFLFEDIQGNSELRWHDDLGEIGFGLTSASGVTDGYGYDDNGKFVDNGSEEYPSRVYYFGDYALRSEVDDLLDKGELVLVSADEYAKCGSVEVNEKKSKGWFEGDLAFLNW